MDNDLTTSIQRACQLMRIKFLDHVIITDGAYYSYCETGRV
jgi:DNA repair protein RadC